MPTIESIQKNIVLIAQSLNPAIYSESWFIKNMILNIEDFDSSTDSIFTPQFVQLKTKYIDLIILPDQIQITLKIDEDKSIEIIKEFVKKSEIDFKFLGINFNYFIKDLNTKEFFYNTTSPLYISFNNPESKFGAYLSKDSIHNSRLKLDIKPVKSSNSNVEFLHHLFNYHIDIKSNSTSEIIETLNKWKDFDKDSVSIISYHLK